MPVEPAFGTSITVPDRLADEMRLRCRSGEFGVKHLQLELSRRLGVWVPVEIAEAFHADYVTGDLS